MKRTIQKLPESELDIMIVLWKQKNDMSRSEIEKIVNQKKTLAPTTILTLLSRLEKGVCICEQRRESEQIPLAGFTDRVSAKRRKRNAGKTVWEFREKFCCSFVSGKRNR